MTCGQLFCWSLIFNLEWLFNKLIWQFEIGESIDFLLVLIFKLCFKTLIIYIFKNWLFYIHYICIYVIYHNIECYITNIVIKNTSHIFNINLFYH